jgi:hypothetical protein
MGAPSSDVLVDIDVEMDRADGKLAGSSARWPIRAFNRMDAKS